MAWEDVGNVFNGVAAATIVANRLVTIGGTDYSVVQSAAATDLSVGVARVAGATGDAIGIQRDGICRTECGAAVTRGQQLISDGSGRVIPTAAGTDVIVGTAFESGGAAGVIISIALGPFHVK